MKYTQNLIKLSDLINQYEKKDSYIKVNCPKCNGTGWTDDLYPVRCFTCCGDGYILKSKEELKKGK